MLVGVVVGVSGQSTMPAVKSHYKYIKHPHCLFSTSYHNVLTEKTTASDSTERQMMEWLAERHIPFQYGMLKPKESYMPS
jgi:hypothetical protein